MDEKDKGLCEKLAGENEEFKRVYDNHQELEKQIAAMEKKGVHSAEDELEEKRIKKLKLAAKDKIEKMLSECR